MLKIKDGYEMRQVAGTWVAVATGSSATAASALLILNDTGAFIWNSIADGLQKEELVKKVMEEYDVDELTAAKDIDSFLEHMLTNDLIEE